MVRLHAAALAALALMAAGPAGALMVDPATGGSGIFFWDEGFGDSVEFGSPPVGDDTLTITLAQDSTFRVFAVADAPVAGDGFVLVINGVESPWTLSGPDPVTGLFEAERRNLFLTAGTHTIDLTVVSTAPGFESGAGFWSMSAAVPEPSSAILACVGVLVLRGAVSRRRAGS